MMQITEYMMEGLKAGIKQIGKFKLKKISDSTAVIEANGKQYLIVDNIKR